jgi:hypothetical protein
MEMEMMYVLLTMKEEGGRGGVIYTFQFRSGSEPCLSRVSSSA